jgi:hypothetical protein
LDDQSNNVFHLSGPPELAVIVVDTTTDARFEIDLGGGSPRRQIQPLRCSGGIRTKVIAEAFT